MPRKVKPYFHVLLFPWLSTIPFYIIAYIILGMLIVPRNNYIVLP